MAKIKWDAATESKLAAAYKAARESNKSNDVTLMELGADFGKSKREVQGKLVHMKVYSVDAKAPAEAKDEGPTKKDYISQLRDLNVPFDADGLIPCTKATIASIVKWAESNKTPEAVAA